MTRRRFLVDSTVAAAGGMAVLTVAPASSGATAVAQISTDPRRGIGLPPRELPAEELLGWFNVINEQVKTERCSPPSAARIYAHTMLAAYEIVALGESSLESMSGRINGLGPIGRISSDLNWPLALNEAIGAAARAVFSDRSKRARAALITHRSERRAILSLGFADPVVHRSIAAGNLIGGMIADRANADGYLNMIGRPYRQPVGPEKWRRTAPTFGAALEPYWAEVQPFVLDGNRECKPIPPVPYSEEAGSAFWQQANHVYKTSLTVTDEQKALALFWRDQPDGSTGLPSGHWLGIAGAVIRAEGLPLDRAAEVLALTAISLADGFTSCWTEKYETNLLRPVTYVQRFIDPTWITFVDSPAFPEYPSGHSAGSAAAAKILTHLLGDSVQFVDTVGRQNCYPDRIFRSFREAAKEAALSALWGGVNYPMGVEQGFVHGQKVARLVIQRLPSRVSV